MRVLPSITLADGVTDFRLFEVPNAIDVCESPEMLAMWHGLHDCKCLYSSLDDEARTDAAFVGLPNTLR
jgi:hypothetical protein